MSERQHAKELDATDPLARFRDQFFFPKNASGEPCLYFTGNSLGLQPKRTREYVMQELEDWERLGVEGHLHARKPWYPYHELVTESLARLVGAKPLEVVAMNSLTVNLNLMLVSFYRPTKERYRIVIEGSAFPSDRYAVSSHASFHGLDPADAIVAMAPREGESCLRTDDILSYLDREGEKVALVLFGNVNYLTGQAFDMGRITSAARAKGCAVGWDLAHGIGNLDLRLHDINADFAVWCSYKYLNAGPGAIAGCFVHERHARDWDRPRFSGWWGHDKHTRFQMAPEFDGMPGAEGWQLSNPPILQLAALRASLELFDEAGLAALQEKSRALTGYLYDRLSALKLPGLQILTPQNPAGRGCQLSLRLGSGAKPLVERLTAAGVISDFREPDVIRIAPVPLYNSFTDVARFIEVLEGSRA